MKIIFFCGSLDPGKDGVGDYTRRLAGALIDKGHSVCMIALNENNIEASGLLSQKENSIEIPVLLLSSNESWDVRMEKAKGYIDNFSPDWLSLQYVPFAFQEKGLPFALANKLKKLTAKAKWHIMFHELWVGMDTDSPFKYKVWGKVQEFIIKHMLSILAPQSINTHTRLYQLHLNRLGYKPEILPLFGNIQRLNNEVTHKQGVINIAVFGGLHFGANIQQFVHWLKGAKNNTFHFQFIGSNGSEREHWIKVLKENEISYTQHGWLEDAQVSLALLQCQWALTSTPYYLIQKSGSVAAMLEHNLQVFCIARNWEPRLVNKNDLVNEAVVNWNPALNINNVIEANATVNAKTLQDITSDFLKQLNN